MLDFGSMSLNSLNLENNEPNKSETIDVLSDIFTSNSISNEMNTDILQPTTVAKDVRLLANKTAKNEEKINNKLKAFEELDALSENLLKQNLSSVKGIATPFNK